MCVAAHGADRMLRNGPPEAENAADPGGEIDVAVEAVQKVEIRRLQSCADPLPVT